VELAVRRGRAKSARPGQRRFAFTGVGNVPTWLLPPEVGQATHIADVVAVLESEDLRDLVLVCHSYADMIMPAVLEACHSRIRAAVYLDALLPRAGESIADVVG
jgi:hypothetical protein